MNENSLRLLLQAVKSSKESGGSARAQAGFALAESTICEAADLWEPALKELLDEGLIKQVEATGGKRIFRLTETGLAKIH